MRAGIVPFIVTDGTKEEYYKALEEGARNGAASLVGYFRQQQLSYLQVAAPLITNNQIKQELLACIGQDQNKTDDPLDFTDPIPDWLYGQTIDYKIPEEYFDLPSTHGRADQRSEMER